MLMACPKRIHPLWFKTTFYIPLEFLKKFIFKRGYKDGLPGFVLAVTSAFYIFLKFAKLWERQNVGEEKPWLDDGE